MNYREPLSQKVVAISISESDDLAVRGLADEHLRDAMTEISRHLLAMGARLVYGGDLRDNGYTRLLFELVARHRRDADIGDSRPAFSNYLPWPVHSTKPRAYLSALREDLEGIGELRCLDRDGRDMAENDLVQLSPDDFTDQDWADSLTSMRRTQTEVIDARIVLGGRVTNFKGVMPGIAEETEFALEAQQPLFLLGGFGGCAGDIAADMDLLPRTGKSTAWPGREGFSRWRSMDLANGLLEDEVATLARTVHVDEAVALILRGLLRLQEASA
ncbi:hypothetical protein JP75_17130 [Devosia riboflavina]|uniref:Uncharacterized protein n=1 Tax=Devosia riboflavina TaxID=46914 RepID=A0A087M086_9HYPH|nr:hypothetical protein [Devosia riboflavina]KFL30289.1 hypothetical protein JP75_17130 [Devosia riboflavina]